MEEFLNELLTFIDKKTDWKVNNDTTNSQVITEFLYRNKELTAQFIASVGKTSETSENSLHKHDVSFSEAVICPDCHKYKRMQGNGIMHQLYEYGSEAEVCDGCGETKILRSENLCQECWDKLP